MKINIAVFFGGQSVEHEVSIITAMQAISAADRDKYDITAVYVSKEGAFYIGEHLSELSSFRDTPKAISQATEVVLAKDGADVVLLRRHTRPFKSNKLKTIDLAMPIFHGTGGEDGVMQGHFERLSLPYSGPNVAASAAGMDKWTMKALFTAAGVPCLPAVRVRSGEFFADKTAVAERIATEITLPCIVKPVNLGSSVGISLAKDLQGLIASFEQAFHYADYALCERAVSPLCEINCSVLGDRDEARASVCEQPLGGGEILSYSDKYQAGASGTKGAKSAPQTAPQGGAKGGAGMSGLSRKLPADLPHELSERIRSIAVSAFHAIDCAGVARVDFLIDQNTGEVFANEINTIPGSLSFYLWEHEGLTFTQLFDRLVALALKRSRDASNLTFSFDTNILSNSSLPKKNGG